MCSSGESWREWLKGNDGSVRLWFKWPRVSLLISAVCLVVILAAGLLYSSSNPKDLRADITVMYLVDPNNGDLFLPEVYDYGRGDLDFQDAQAMFKRFRQGLPAEKDPIRNTLSGHKTAGYDDRFTWRVFRDLTEYLVIYYLGSHYSTSDGMERLDYRRETRRWWAIPDPSIRGKDQTLSDIKGLFRDNLFYGVKGSFDVPEVPLSLQLPMPKDTSICLRRGMRTFSERFRIENEFTTIDIGIAFLVGQSQGFTFARESEEKRPYRALLKFETCIYYDVKYKRWPYSFGQREYHEEWVKDLLAVLQRKFSWGNPRLAEDAELSLFWRRMAERQSQQPTPKTEAQPK
jgi:hypothetical protein